MARLEKAVQEIVSLTTDQVSERATRVLDDTSRRLEAELRLRRETPDDDVELQEAQARRRRRTRYRHRLVDRAERVNPRSGRLYRDPQNQKIGGVCAGVARYFGIEAWAVRLGALTGLIFLPGIVFPAYWIAYFIMDKPETDEPVPRRRRRNRKANRPSSDTNQSHYDLPEPRQPFAPSRSLRYTSADLTQAELRLRQLESFITSDQYELQKELHKIEREEHQGQQPGARTHA